MTFKFTGGSMSDLRDALAREADPQISPNAVTDGRALVMHRMMQGKSKHWDGLSEGDKLNAIADAIIVLEAAAKVE